MVLLKLIAYHHKKYSQLFVLISVMRLPKNKSKEKSWYSVLDKYIYSNAIIMKEIKIVS